MATDSLVHMKMDRPSFTIFVNVHGDDWRFLMVWLLFLVCYDFHPPDYLKCQSKAAAQTAFNLTVSSSIHKIPVVLWRVAWRMTLRLCNMRKEVHGGLMSRHYEVLEPLC